MDIFQRTCCKPYKKEIQEEEIEIFEADSPELSGFEEEAIEAEEEEQIDAKAVYTELECMKKRIQKLQLLLKAKVDKCPEEECVDFEILLQCSKNPEICTLQKDQYKLQCQINELIRCCQVAKDQIKDLRLRMCERSRDILELQKLVAVLMKWKNTLDHEFGVCIERFEYLKHVKAEWQDVAQKFDEQRNYFAEMEESFVPKICFLQDKKFFITAITELKELLREIINSQYKRFMQLEERCNQITKMQNPNLSLQLESKQ